MSQRTSAGVSGRGGRSGAGERRGAEGGWGSNLRGERRGAEGGNALILFLASTPKGLVLPRNGARKLHAEAPTVRQGGFAC